MIIELVTLGSNCFSFGLYLSYRSIVIIKLENIGYLGFYFYEIVVPQAKETALSMAADGMKAEKIAHYLKVSAAMVQNGSLTKIIKCALINEKMYMLRWFRTGSMKA